MAHSVGLYSSAILESRTELWQCLRRTAESRSLPSESWDELLAVGRRAGRMAEHLGSKEVFSLSNSNIRISTAGMYAHWARLDRLPAVAGRTLSQRYKDLLFNATKSNNIPNDFREIRIFLICGPRFIPHPIAGCGRNAGKLAKFSRYAQARSRLRQQVR